MLEFAINYEEELRKNFLNIYCVEKYKYYSVGRSFEIYKHAEFGDWLKREYVSLAKDGSVLGYIGYSIDRDANVAWGLSIINFSENKIIFGKDAMKAVKDIFELFKLRKLSFSVYVGNPIEKTYDKLIKKYGGRIIGIAYEDSITYDGELVDLKRYEITMKDYMENKKGENNG